MWRTLTILLAVTTAALGRQARPSARVVASGHGLVVVLVRDATTSAGREFVFSVQQAGVPESARPFTIAQDTVTLETVRVHGPTTLAVVGTTAAGAHTLTVVDGTSGYSLYSQRHSQMNRIACGCSERRSLDVEEQHSGRDLACRANRQRLKRRSRSARDDLTKAVRQCRRQLAELCLERVVTVEVQLGMSNCDVLRCGLREGLLIFCRRRPNAHVFPKDQSTVIRGWQPWKNRHASSDAQRCY